MRIKLSKLSIKIANQDNYTQKENNIKEGNKND